jgi:hypothetical protein
MARGSISRTTVSPRVAVTRFRAVPGVGEILVREGDVLDAAQVVAKIEKPGDVYVVDVAAQLGIPRGRIAETLAVKAGDPVSAGQVLAECSALFGMWKARAVSPEDGIVDTVSKVTGQVVVRAKPTIMDLRAFVSGCVSSVIPGAGVEILAEVSLLQGILGLGGEAMGRLAIVDPRNGALERDDLSERHRKEVVATFGRISLCAMRRAKEVGVAALVGSSAFGEELVSLMGVSPNLAAAGDEELGFALLLTEGLGDLRMAPRAAALLRRLEGARVSVNAVTQVRAGVIRPDLLGPPIEGAELASDEAEAALRAGSRVRIVRGKRFGSMGEIVEAPASPCRVDSGAFALVYELRLDDGSRARVPRQNVEAEM